jgi:hypothetical protein
MDYQIINKWVVMGVYYGYPVCCIENFYYKGGTLNKDQKKVHYNTGFIPCPECACKILKGGITLHELIKDRFCSIKFPNTDI